jgi:hypothetical protein
LSDQGLAYYGNRVARPPRRGPLTRSVSWVLVALVHILLITLFVMSEILPDQETRHTLPIETMFLLSMLPNTHAPQVKIIKPEVPNATVPVITTAPLVVVPLEEPPMIQPETPADILKSIGEALACGANSFEYLTQAQRNHCPHQPWLGRRLPDGVIVLDAPPKAAEEPTLHMSGAEQLRHDLQTGPACPILQQAPCLHDVLTGANMKPP